MVTGILVVAVVVIAAGLAEGVEEFGTDVAAGVVGEGEGVLWQPESMKEQISSATRPTISFFIRVSS